MSFSFTTSTKFCQVNGCRFSDSHLTKAHKCGNCGKFGHGQNECGNFYMSENLKHISKGIQFPSDMKCTSAYCPASYSHSSNAHYCSQCGDRHLESVCPKGYVMTSDNQEIIHAKTEASKLFGDTDGKIYTTIYVGQGCEWYVKRNFKFGPIQLFFMHGDSWGQYGPKIDNRDRLEAFCTGYKNIANGQMFVLP
jgi:hypothetical protein